jgi:hypothetical protein
MGGDDYVIDEKRGIAWSNASEAARWYREQLDAKGWQPIETAPRDRPFLVWNGEWVQLTYWTNAYTGDDGYQDGWFEDVSGDVPRVFWHYEGLDDHRPTHWMPLPEPPKE